MATPKAGTKVTLSSKQGIGEGFGAIPFGTEVEVTDVHDSGTPGTGDVGDDKVVRLEFKEPGLVLDDEGNPVNGEVLRAITVSLYDYNKLFRQDES